MHAGRIVPIATIRFDFQDDIYISAINWRGSHIPSESPRKDYFDFRHSRVRHAGVLEGYFVAPADSFELFMIHHSPTNLDGSLRLAACAAEASSVATSARIDVRIGQSYAMGVEAKGSSSATPDHCAPRLAINPQVQLSARNYGEAHSRLLFLALKYASRIEADFAADALFYVWCRKLAVSGRDHRVCAWEPTRSATTPR
jgi:hypothetical protein